MRLPGDEVKFVIVASGPITIFDVEKVRAQAISIAKESDEVPVLMTCGDPLKDPLTADDMEKIREMIDSEIAWVRIGNKIAHLIRAGI